MHGPGRVLIADDIDYYRRCREVFDLQAKLDRWVTETGRGPDELVEDAMADYFDKLARTREMLNNRHDDLKSGSETYFS